ncbi:hypothetical protein M3J09_009528 [Ascochyta lentis]
MNVNALKGHGTALHPQLQQQQNNNTKHHLYTQLPALQRPGLPHTSTLPAIPICRVLCRPAWSWSWS